MVNSASAVSIPEPSAPKFSVYLVNDPYEVPATSPTYTVDPYTGEQKQVTSGSASYTVDNVTLQLWVLNEQLSYSNGTTSFQIYFDVRTKGHYEENWTDLGYSFEGLYTLESKDRRTYFGDYQALQTGYKYTVLTFSATTPAQYYSSAVAYPANATVDFQVKVVIGHQATLIRSRNVLVYSPYEDIGTALDAQSGWSETQSITINVENIVLASTLENPAVPVSSPIPLPTDTPQPTAIITPTPSAASTPTLTPTTTPPNAITNQNAFSENIQTLIIITIAATALISILIYVRNRKIERNKKPS
jgi:hypothetical protein